MFTGIIQTIGSIENIQKKEDIVILTIHAPKIVTSLKQGDSVAIDGVCYTVTSLMNEDTAVQNSFTVEAMPETQARTILGFYKPGTIVNLELPLKIGERLHGHFVQGHVDTIEKIITIKDTGKSKTLSISLSPDIKPFVVFKGSICINGVSLTISSVNNDSFEVSLIPQTLAATNLKLLGLHSYVNIEIDTLARYLVNLMHENQNQPSSQS